MERYLELALTQNPAIAVAKAQADAYAQMPIQESALPDPMIGFGVRDLGSTESLLDRTEMTSRWISLEQEFPFPGTLGRKRDRAQAMQRMSEAMFDETKSMLIADVKEIYFEWSYLRLTMDLLGETKALMEQSLVQALESYRVGMGTQSDIFRAQTELARIENEFSDLAQMERRAIADINICCNLPPDKVTQLPSPLSDSRVDISFDTLWSWIQEKNPELRAASARRDAAESDRALARRMRYPMFRFGAEFMRRGIDHPENAMSFMGGVTLPLYWSKRQNPMVTQKTLELEQNELALIDVSNQLRFKLTDYTAKVKSLAEQIARFDSLIIPQAEQTFSAAKAGYIAGKVDFMDVLSSQMLVAEMKRERAMKTAEYLQTWAMIEGLTGRRVF